MESEQTETEAQTMKAEHHGFTIFIDATRYHVTQTSMTGAQLKALAGIDAQYQLYLEEVGDEPDKLINDHESVPIKDDMHFFAIPPATFGQVFV